MAGAIKAGLFYFAIVFCIGFVIGTVRAVFLVPFTGEILAVILELPLMIAVSWWTCGFVLRRCPVDDGTIMRLMMGVVALALLLIGELGVSMMLAGRSVAQHAALYLELPAQLGLLAQVPFALFPAFRRWIG